jgi:hypothetical protein
VGHGDVALKLAKNVSSSKCSIVDRVQLAIGEGMLFDALSEVEAEHARHPRFPKLLPGSPCHRAFEALADAARGAGNAAVLRPCLKALGLDWPLFELAVTVKDKSCLQSLVQKGGDVGAAAAAQLSALASSAAATASPAPASRGAGGPVSLSLDVTDDEVKPLSVRCIAAPESCPEMKLLTKLYRHDTLDRTLAPLLSPSFLECVGAIEPSAAASAAAAAAAAAVAAASSSSAAGAGGLSSSFLSVGGSGAGGGLSLGRSASERITGGSGGSFGFASSGGGGGSARPPIPFDSFADSALARSASGGLGGATGATGQGIGGGDGGPEVDEEGFVIRRDDPPAAKEKGNFSDSSDEREEKRRAIRVKIRSKEGEQQLKDTPLVKLAMPFPLAGPMSRTRGATFSLPPPSSSGPSHREAVNSMLGLSPDARQRTLSDDNAAVAEVAQRQQQQQQQQQEERATMRQPVFDSDPFFAATPGPTPASPAPVFDPFSLGAGSGAPFAPASAPPSLFSASDPFAPVPGAGSEPAGAASNLVAPNSAPIPRAETFSGTGDASNIDASMNSSFGAAGTPVRAKTLPTPPPKIIVSSAGTPPPAAQHHAHAHAGAGAAGAGANQATSAGPSSPMTSPVGSGNPSSPAIMALQNGTDHASTEMTKALEQLEAGGYGYALTHVDEALRYLGHAGQSSQATFAARYRVTLRLLLAVKHEEAHPTGDAAESRVRTALLCQFLCSLPIATKHRLVCLRMALKRNMDAGNFGVAAFLIAFMLPRSKAAAAEALKEQLAQCEAQGKTDRAARPYTCPACSTQDRLPTEFSCAKCTEPVRFCYRTFEVIPEDHYASCQHCTSVFSPKDIGALCPACKHVSLTEAMVLPKRV